MKPAPFQSQRGSLVLVALCMVAVLAIALASYLAVSLQAMRLSDRSSQTALSAHLAEIGLEEALRGFNSNNWSTYTANGTTTTWSVSGTTASCTLTLPASKFAKGGSGGVTGSIKIRVDNYNAYNLSATWASGTAYSVNDLVANSGIWYRCLKAHTSSSSSQPPDLRYWAETPIGWMWSKDISYSVYELVNYNGIWYRCTSSNSNQPPPNASYWAAIPVLTLPWSSTVTYSYDSFAYSSTFSNWYHYTSGVPSSGNLVSDPGYWTATTTASPFIEWRWTSSAAYSPNDLVYRSGTWYRCILAHSNQAPPNSLYWEDAVGVYWVWSSSNAYQVGDVVYRGGVWYRCIQAHTNQGPPNTSYWSSAPLLGIAWDSNRGYAANDTVSYNGVWYRCLIANTNSNPAYNPSNWASAANASYNWSSSTTYSTGNYVSYGRVWYRCIATPTSNQSPNNSTYWKALGAPVIYAEGTVTLPDGTASIKTQLRATVTTAPLFPNALAATSTLTINGAGTVDSYDASSGTYNQTTTPFTAGSPNVGYSAVLAGGNTSGTAVTVTSATVKGYVAAPSASTSPYAPLWSYGVGASVSGTSSPIVDLTRVSRSPYIPQFDIQPVANSVDFALVNNTTNTIGTPGARQATVYNITSSLNRINLNTSTDILYIVGPVVLNVASDFNISNGRMIIASTGSAEIHFAGNLAISGTYGIDNRTLDPKKLILMSSSTGGTYSYTATTPFYGCIYLPNATSPLTLGASSTFYGALSAKNITFSGAANFHYDTSLRYATFEGVDAPYTLSEWRELTDPAERAVLP